mgnify:CR=1 FL=1|jgi:hypothetical protein
MNPDRESVSQDKVAASGWRGRGLMCVLCTSALFILVVLIYLCFDSHNRTWAQKQIYIISGLDPETQVADSVDTHNKYTDKSSQQILEGLRGRGELMTSDEFASRITSYYNTLVAVLGIMVAVFTFASYFLVSNFYKNEFERERLRIVADLEEGISKKVSWALRDSSEVRRTVAENIRGDIEPYFTQVETTEDMIKQLTDHEQKLSDMGRQLADLQETVPSKLEVVVGDAGKHGDHGC